MPYIRRIVDDELDDLFHELPAVALDGAKGVGKTSTAEQRAAGVASLDSRAVRTAIEADPASLLARPRPLLIDEWQRVPEVWDVVRHAVDASNRGEQFLLTGSATPVEGSTSHSGAGRIVRIRMRPMTLTERGITPSEVSLRTLLSGARPELHGETGIRLHDYVEEIAASGLPGLRGLSSRASRAQLDGYLRNIVDRDVAENGVKVRKPDVMLDWMRAYAAGTATTASYANILDAATAGFDDKPDRGTTATYRDALQQLWILDPVPAWTASGTDLARLQQTPKHHLADPAFALRLLDITPAGLLNGEGKPIGPQQGTLLGHLFESLVTLCVRVPAQAAEATVRHLRTRNGDHEVDLIVVRGDGKVLAVEVKLSGTVTDSDVRHLRWLREMLGERLMDAIVVNTGPVSYRRPDGIGVVPLALLGP